MSFIGDFLFNWVFPPSKETVRKHLFRAADDGVHLGNVLALLERYEREERVDVYHQTPLHWASTHGFDKIVRLLLLQKDVMMDVDIQDINEQTPLHWACHGGHAAVVKLLLERGANVNAKLMMGETPLHVAVKRQRDWAVKKDEVDGKSDVTWSNYIIAAPGPGIPAGYLFEQRIEETGYTPTIELLLKHGANVNVADNFGKIPLHLACIRGDEVAIQLLLKYGSDVTATNNEGLTATNVAEQLHFTAVVKLLEPFVSFDSRAQLELEIWRLQQNVDAAQDSMDPSVVASAMEANSRMELLKSYRQHVLFPSAAQLEKQIQELEDTIRQLAIGQNKLDLCITREKLLHKLGREKAAQIQLNQVAA